MTMIVDMSLLSNSRLAVEEHQSPVRQGRGTHPQQRLSRNDSALEEPIPGLAA